MKNKLTIGLVGDVMLGRLVNKFLPEKNYSYPWGDVLPLLKKIDLNIINLENTFTNSNKIIPKTFNFKAYPDRVKILKEGNIHIANLANNHILDFSYEGMFETIETLDKEKIKHVGAGKNIEEAEKSLHIKLKNTNIAIIGLTDNEPEWKADNKKPGVNYIEFNKSSAKSLEKTLKEIKNKVDILILSLHWGPNMTKEPSEDFKDFAHSAIDYGADIIHGHSAHIFQGIEIYKKKVIMYDTGDFIDDYAIDPFLRNDRSFLFLVEMGNKKFNRVILYPTIISNFKVNFAKGKDFNEILQRMRFLCKEMKTEIKKSKNNLYIEI